MRLRKRSEFVAVQAGEDRAKLHGRRFLVLVRERDEAHTSIPGAGRIGITVSKKVGNAVVRNRIRRWVREYVRRDRSWLPAGRDVVVIATHDAAQLTHQAEVSRDLSALGRRLAQC
ncbi:MAG TPA: ribonuclease P protein component [Kofleriaceae bacterium]|nr:ribonuclease P protein component [Kofleriaceae bacterium]